jgi:aspartate/methionine/tyrosine aminotransferase
VALPFFLSRLLARSGAGRFLPSVQRWTDGGGAFVQFYSDRVLAAPYPDLRAAADFLELSGPDAIDLGTGTPRFDLVPSTSTKLPADRRGWPPTWGLPELRAAVADQLRADGPVSYNPADEVLITPGAAGAFTLALDTFLNPGGRVVLLDPTSPLYWLALRQRRARIRWVPTWVEDGRVRFHLQSLARALRGARLVVLSCPANPTGGTFAAEDFDQIAWWADRNDTLIVNDEVFASYRYDGALVRVTDIPRARPRTITLGSVSKAYGLAAARVGWLAGHRHLVRPCALSAALQTLWVPTLCQQIALAALRQGEEALGPVREELRSRRQYVYERLRSLGLSPAWPAGAFFFWVPVGDLGLDGQTFAERLRQARKVLVWPGRFFGPSGRDYVRLSYAAEEGRVHEGLARLADFVRALRSSEGPAEPQAA